MNTREIQKRFLLLQINDALFPIGAYSHSYGLETYIQKNLIKSVDETWDFIHKRMVYGFMYNEFLSARLAYEYASAQRLDKLIELEDILEACRIPRETREAGRKLGSRFVKTIGGMNIPYKSDIFNAYIEKRRAAGTTHCVVYGAFCACCEISFEDAMECYLYAQCSSMITNCVKTIPLSQTDGQHLLFKCHGMLAGIIEKLTELTEDDLCLSAPGFDIRCMQHEALYSRIYMS